MPTSYGQFCPVAKAMELLDERWTLLVVRELMMGSQHFNDLRRGLPRMSPTLLSKRLQTLVRAGVVERSEEGNRVHYQLSPAGKELEPIVEALGSWGIRWVPEIGDEDLDPHLLLWDIHRHIAVDALPEGRTVLQFDFTDVPVASRQWWIVITDEGVDVCDADPGFDVRVAIETGLRTLTPCGEVTSPGPPHYVRERSSCTARNEPGAPSRTGSSSRPSPPHPDQR